MNENLVRRYGLRKVVGAVLRELVLPTEGDYRPVAPSGNWLYSGPPLGTRIRERLRGDYNRGDER